MRQTHSALVTSGTGKFQKVVWLRVTCHRRAPCQMWTCGARIEAPSTKRQRLNVRDADGTEGGGVLGGVSPPQLTRGLECHELPQGGPTVTNAF